MKRKNQRLWMLLLLFCSLQGGNAVKVDGYHCVVTYSKSVTRCGFGSITYQTIATVFETAVQIEPEACRIAANRGTIRVLGRLFDIKINIPKIEIYFSQGNVDADGVCEAASFMSGGKAFTGAVESTSVIMRLKQIRRT
jgi:hypothetical protein